MRLLMISGDRSVVRGMRGAFWYTLEEFHGHFQRIDIICPHAEGESIHQEFGNVFFHANPGSLLSQPRWIATRGEELIRKFGHNVMTVHEYPPFYNGLGARTLHRRMGIPYCLEIHHIVGEPV